MLSEWHPNIYVFASLSAVISGLGAAAFVFFHGQHTPAGRPFVILCTSASLWCLFPTLSSLPLPEHIVLNLARASYLPASWALAAYAHLAFMISEDERLKLRRRWLWILYTIAFGITLISFSPYFITGLIRFAPHFAVVGGPLYHLIVALSVLSLTVAWTVAVRNLKRLSVTKRNQLRYFLVASVILGFCPLLHFGGFYFRSEPIPHDFLVPIFVLLVAYAITRHHVLDIEVVLRRSLVYSLLIACLTATYLVMILVMERWFQGFFGYRSIFATLIVAFLIAIFFDPVRNWIQARVDRALFKGTPVELAEQREQLLHEVQKSEQRKAVATLAAGMAHEIKNPLSSIKIFAEFLPEKYDDPSFRETFTRIVTQEVGKINDLVQRLLDFAKPNPPQKQPVRLSRLIDETVELLHNALVQQHIEIVRADASADTVLADPAQVKQALLNVLLNSIEAMQHPGRITVSTVSVDGHLEVIVADTGPGIAPHDLARVFEPFYTTKAKGTGLGLAVVQRIVHEHGGRVRLDSAPGRGTTVRMQFVSADIRPQTSDGATV